jgi:membrane-bound ClpP family serine protease
VPIQKFAGILLLLAAAVLFVLAFNSPHFVGWRSIAAVAAVVVGGGMMYLNARAQA